MRKIILFLFLIISASCNRKPDVQQPGYNTVPSRFLNHLLNGNIDLALSQMDLYVTANVDSVQLKESIRSLSQKIVFDYGNNSKISFLTSENTVHEGLNATFSIYKISSKQRFGYYFFYTNDRTNKILLVSEFTRPKQAR